MARKCVKLTPQGEMAQIPILGEIISELFQSCGLRLDAPAGTQECPLSANNVISATRCHRSPPVLSTSFPISITAKVTLEDGCFDWLVDQQYV